MELDGDSDTVMDGTENSKEKRKRRPQYYHNESFANSDHWTKEQEQFYHQCESAFDLLVEGSLQFDNDFWQGVLPNATKFEIDKFIEIYSSESKQVFRIKQSTQHESNKQAKAVKLDIRRHDIWNAMDHMEDEQKINVCMQCYLSKILLYKQHKTI